MLREIGRKLATVRYINVALGRPPSSDCSSIQEVRWCLSQVTTSRAEQSPSVTTNGQFRVGTRDCIELRPSVDSFRVGRAVYFHRPRNTDRDFYHPSHHLVLHYFRQKQDLYQERVYSIDLRFPMEWDHFNQFVDPNDLQNSATVPPQDLAWDHQLGVPGEQDDFSANNLADTTKNLPSLPTLNNRRRVSPMSTSRGPMRILGSMPSNTTLPKSTPLHLPPSAATAPTLPRTRALAKAKLMSTHPGSTHPAWRRTVRPAALLTQGSTSGVQQTLLLSFAKSSSPKSSQPPNTAANRPTRVLATLARSLGPQTRCIFNLYYYYMNRIVQCLDHLRDSKNSKYTDVL